MQIQDTYTWKMSERVTPEIKFPTFWNRLKIDQDRQISRYHSPPIIMNEDQFYYSRGEPCTNGLTKQPANVSLFVLGVCAMSNQVHMQWAHPMNFSLSFLKKWYYLPVLLRLLFFFCSHDWKNFPENSNSYRLLGTSVKQVVNCQNWDGDLWQYF
jgi:hypothetical protein